MISRTSSGRGAEEDAREHRVHADRLAGAGGAGDQQMRHRREVADERLAVDGLAERERQLRLRAPVGVRLEQLAQRNLFAVRVGNLDADGGLAGNAIDQHRLGLHRQAEVVGEAGDLAVFHAGVGLELVGRDDRTRVDLHDRAFDRELAALLFEQPRAFHQLALVDLALGLRRIEQRQRRERVGAPSCARPAAFSGSGSGSGRRGRHRPLDCRRRRGLRRRRLERRGRGADHRRRAGRLRRRRLLGARAPGSARPASAARAAAATSAGSSARPCLPASRSRACPRGSACRGASSALPAAASRAASLRAARAARRASASHWSAIIEPIAANSRPNENCVDRMTARNSSVRIRMIEPVRFRYSASSAGEQRCRCSRRRGTPPAEIQRAERRARGRRRCRRTAARRRRLRVGASSTRHQK